MLETGKCIPLVTLMLEPSTYTNHVFQGNIIWFASTKGGPLESTSVSILTDRLMIGTIRLYQKIMDEYVLTESIDLNTKTNVDVGFSVQRVWLTCKLHICWVGLLQPIHGCISANAHMILAIMSTILC